MSKRHVRSQLVRWLLPQQQRELGLVLKLSRLEMRLVLYPARPEPCAPQVSGTFWLLNVVAYFELGRIMKTFSNVSRSGSIAVAWAAVAVVVLAVVLRRSSPGVSVAVVIVVVAVVVTLVVRRPWYASVRVRVSTRTESEYLLVSIHTFMPTNTHAQRKPMENFR